MTYAGSRIIFDADSHLMELPDFLSAHASSDIRDKLPDLNKSLRGQFNPDIHLGKKGQSPENVKSLLALGRNITKGPKWHDALGAFNGKERGQALDLLGFQKQVVFSSFCARLIFGSSNDDIAYGSAAAHNRAMNAFCEMDQRLIGVAIVPFQDPVRALVEIKQAIKLNLGAIWIAADAPGGRSPGHPDHHHLWATLAEAGLPFILHVGSSPLMIGDKWMNDGMTGNLTARGGAEVIGSKDLTAIHFASNRFLSTLVLDGVLETHPNLMGGVIEIGAGWVPDMIRRLDHAVEIWSRSEPQLAKMKRLPREQIAQQLRFTPYPFEDVAQLVSESNSDLYMFSSDYPHAEGGRDPIGRFTRSTKTLTKEDQEKFFSKNFIDLYPNVLDS